MTTWTQKISDRLKHVEKDVPWWVNDKVKLYRFCQKHDLPMPEMFEKWRRPEELSLENLPETFVLKPSVMHSSWGVMVLEQQPGTAHYKDLLSGRLLTEDAIRREQERVFEKCKYKGSYHLFAERRIPGPEEHGDVPLDYKVFCFHDRIGLIQQIDRNGSPARHAWLDGDFTPLELDGRITSDWSKVQLGRHAAPEPETAAAMLEIAARATRALSTPFMRVDMFLDGDTPVIGEMTPAPGGPYYKDWYSFTDEFDAELGALWVEAEREMTGSAPAQGLA